MRFSPYTIRDIHPPKSTNVALLKLLHILSMICLTALLSGLHAEQPRWAEHSVLEKGDWFKLRVTSTGIYKLTYEELRAMGITQPEKAHIYGYGGAPLSEDFNAHLMDDLPEVALYRSVGSDGQFGPGDYILFYAQGPVLFYANRQSALFSRTQNPYSLYGYYFLTESDRPVLEMQSQSEEELFEQEIDFFNDYYLHEKELASVASSGRNLYGESFSFATSQSFTFPIEGVLPRRANLHVEFIAKAPIRTSLQIDFDVLSETRYLEASPAGEQYEKARLLSSDLPFTPTLSANPTVQLRYGQTGHTNVRLDYLLYNYVRSLRLYGSYTFFRLSDPSWENIPVKYRVSAPSSSLLFDLTDRQKPTLITSRREGEAITFIGKNHYSEDRLMTEYAVVNPSSPLPKPELTGRVPNQDLHGLAQTDMVIITSSALKSQAERLATFHQSNDTLHVTVVEAESIYNEFSSGTPDATAYRRFMKMFYDRSQSAGQPPRYLLLFGDGTFDNRMITYNWAAHQRESFLLTYQSNHSLNEVMSYVTDDYFGFLENSGGETPERALLNLGIGRLPVSSLQEATQVVDKIIAYASTSETGAWKNQVAFVADDGDGNLHMEQADEVAQYVVNNSKDYAVNKIYLDAFKRETMGGGLRYPSVNKWLLEKIQSGLFLINYVGHGSTSAWASEQIMTVEMITSMRNSRLPLWVTATCDFSRFDYTSHSAGEYALLNPNGGAIALFSTTRVVYSGPNHLLNTQLIRNVFNKEENSRPRLGDIIRTTKRALGNDFNKLNFTLLGDPALRLNYPESKASVVTLNDYLPDDTPQQLKALQPIRLTGKIHRPTGEFDPSFNGTIQLRMYDAEEEYTTLDNAQTGKTFTYKDRKNLLFSGKDSVRNGEFEFQFTLPKAISYSNRQGRMNLYAESKKSGEALGHFDHFIVGGSADTTHTDDKGPEIISLFLNNPAFQQDNRVNRTPQLHVELSDESGINISGSGIGHDLIAIIDNDPKQSYLLNDYFQPTLGEAGKGTILFTLPPLSEGSHQLFFRAWDIVGNSSSATIQFEVVENLAPRLFDLYVNNNPASDYVIFYVVHDRPGTAINLRIEVFSIQGIKVWEHNEPLFAESYRSRTIPWNLRDNSLVPLDSGIYLYRATLTSHEGIETTKTKKLIIRNIR